MFAPLRAELAWIAWKYPLFQRLVAPACGKGKRGRSPASSPGDEKESFTDISQMPGQSEHVG
jgi:hypothetical protein